MEKDLMELVNGCGVAEAVKSDKVAGAKDKMKMLQFLGFKKAASGIKQRVDPIVKKAQISALGFIEIKPEKILEYLERKAAEYNKARAKEKKTRAQQSTQAVTQHIANHYGQLASALIGNAGTFTTQNLGAQNSAAQYYSGYTAIDTTPQLGNVLWSNGTTMTFDNAYGVSQSAERISAPTVDISSTAPGTVGRFEWLEEKVEDYAGIPPEPVLEKFSDVKRKNAFDYYTVASVNSVPDPLLLGRIHNSNSRYFIAQWGKDVCLDDVI